MAHTLTSEDSRKGAQVVNANLHQARLQTYERGRLLDQVTQSIETGDIGTAAYQTALDVIQAVQDRAATGLPLDESIDIYRAAQVAETIFKIHRLATGQSTSNAAHATVDPVELQARLAALQPAPTGDTPGTGTPDA